MLRKLIIGAIVANFAFMLIGVITTTDDFLRPSFANTTISGSASATVPQILELISGGIRKIDANESLGDNPWDYPNVTSFDFGTLVYDSDLGYSTGEYFFVTLMIPVTSGRPYTITETGSITGTGNIDDAFLNIPDYQYDDVLGTSTQEAMPGDATLGTVSSAVGSNLVYQDGGSSGESKIIRGVIAISGPPAGESFPINYPGGHDGSTGVGTKNEFATWTPITGDTPGGSYSGSVTYTLTTP